jgi:hypothetical protein
MCKTLSNGKRPNERRENLEGALLHKYLKPLRGKDRQLKALIDKTLYDKAFRRKAESLCNNASCSPKLTPQLRP